MFAVFFDILYIVEDIDDGRQQGEAGKAERRAEDMRNIEKIHIEEERDNDEDIFYPVLDSQKRGVIINYAKKSGGGGG
jgi:nanoRNase/pAp phosphatase (c-di-AMP/oligoRNAs hydrolase)